MSKTHWLAVLQVFLTTATASGFIDEATSQSIQYLLGALFAGTLLHRGYKIAQGTAQP